MDGTSLLRLTLGRFRWGLHDPCCRLSDTEWVRATLTPDGPATIRLGNLASHEPSVEAFGPGAECLVERVQGFLGRNDTDEPVIARHEAVAGAQRVYGGVRLGRSDDPYHELLPAVLGQRVTTGEAARQWAAIVRRWGEPAPGSCGVMLPPRPAVLARVPYYELHPLGIERHRARALVAVARVGDLLIGSVSNGSNFGSTLSLTSIDGVGPWTAAVAGAVSFGDPDALPVGDFHAKNTVAWALAGRPRGTDDEMVELLEPYRGQRLRVLRWLELAGWHAPRFGPGRRTLDIGSL